MLIHKDIFLKAEEIKRIREELELTQEELATILGITKVSIARYESSSSSPQGDIERKLTQLKQFIDNNEDKEKLINMRRKKGGVAAIAGLAAIGAAAIPAPAIMGAAFSIGTIAATAPAILLGKFLSDFINHK